MVQLTIGTANTSALTIGATGITTTNNGAETVTQLLPHQWLYPIKWCIKPDFYHRSSQHHRPWEFHDIRGDQCPDLYLNQLQYDKYGYQCNGNWCNHHINRSIYYPVIYRSNYPFINFRNVQIGNAAGTIQFISTNFNLSTAGVLSIVGNQSPDITTSVAGNSISIRRYQRQQLWGLGGTLTLLQEQNQVLAEREEDYQSLRRK